MKFTQRIKAAFEIMASGYTGVIDSRYRNPQAYNKSPVGDEDSVIGTVDRTKVRLELRYEYRNNPLARGVVDRLASYAIFTGIYPQARTKKAAWNKEAEQWWRSVYVPAADYRQMAGVDLITFQKQNISERLISGDIGYILLKNGQLQPIEAPRIATPSKLSSDKKIIDGVRVNKSGLTLGYYVCPRKQNGGYVDLTKFKYVRRENFIHCWKQTRPDMVRGIPDLAPLINYFRDYGETDEAIRAKIKNDAFTWAKSKNDGPRVGMRNRGSYTLSDSGSKNPQRVEKVEGLRLLNMGKGEDVDGFESKTPNSEYTPYQKAYIQIMAQCLGLPYEFMMLIFTQGSFSAIRASMIHAHHAVLDWNSWNNKIFNRRVWNWRVAKAIRAGELPPAPLDDKGISEWWKVEWSLPFWQELDTDKQTKGDLAGWKMGKESMKSIIGRGGSDRTDVFTEKAEDILDAEKIAKEKLGDKNRWRDIIDTSQPGQTVNTETKKDE